MTTPFNNAFFHAYKNWWRYNNPPGAVPPTNAWIKLNYPAGPPPGPIAPPPPVQPPPTALGKVLRDRTRPPLSNPLGPADLALLAPVPGLTGAGNPATWRGVKLLGSDTFGHVTLWEYVGPPLAPGVATKVAIKTTDVRHPDFELDDEAMFLQNLIPTPPALPSKHIVELIVNPPRTMTNANVAAQGVPAGWAGKVRRLILEYCPQGSLQRLFQERRRRNFRFEELTLWRIFDCLVDGCLVMEHRSEADMTAAGVATVPVASIAGTAADPGAVLHFDLKPRNILGGNRDPNIGHNRTPVFKAPDFGLAEFVDRIPANVVPAPDFATCNILRKIGTRGYLAPEQFSPKWNLAGHVASPVCGKYGTATNVWGIGCILYELTCFNKGPPEAYLPFLATPPLAIHGAPGRGILFGTHLQGTAYSKFLKDTIHECLYEQPSNRPNLIQLKNRILAQIQIWSLAGPPEAWKDLDCPDPLTPAEAGTLPEARRQCTFIGRINKGPARQCTVFELRRPNQTFVRCRSHWDLRRFP